MVARAQIVKWGNSLAVRIPKNVAEAAEFREGDRLVLEVESRGALALKAAKAPPTLEELIARITPQNRHKEQWADRPVGNEVW
jgi:antitoxin MazE